MKHKTCELEGALLDAAVAKAEGLRFQVREWQFDPPGRLRCFADWAPGAPAMTMSIYSPSTDWGLSGPIIERERIDLAAPAHVAASGKPPQWSAAMWRDGFYEHEQFGPTPLIAAMRAYVASKLCEEVDL